MHTQSVGIVDYYQVMVTFLIFTFQDTDMFIGIFVADVPDVENLDLILRERTVAKVIILYYIVSKLKKKMKIK